MSIDLRLGDCLDVLRTLPDGSVDAVVTDPPYGLSFMGKKWDYDVPEVAVWEECLRVLKPGGHLLAFAGTRTQHRMAVRIEDAGFEIRDMIAWVYGSGFPKSLDVGKAMDNAAGAEREVVGVKLTNTGMQGGNFSNKSTQGEVKITTAATDEAKQWQGWGTALKPALEPITMARKPLAGTVAANVLAHGCGALNIDGCRVEAEKQTGWSGRWSCGFSRHLDNDEEARPVEGRWPANFIHDGGAEVEQAFPLDGALSASRFFYCAKASQVDRDDGVAVAVVAGVGALRDGGRESKPRANHHPTVKPTDLMRYLCRLVTPPGGVILDPFMGSGSTGRAAVMDGFRFVGIEREAEYFEIAKARIEAARGSLGLFAPEITKEAA